MALDATVRARVDGQLKEEVEAIFSQISLSTFLVTRVFLKCIKYKKWIPFDLKVPNATTLQVMEEAKNNDAETVSLNEFLQNTQNINNLRNRKVISQIIYSLRFSCLLFFIIGCGTKTPSFNGKVIDSDTKLPIKNADIVAKWVGIGQPTALLDGLKYQVETYKIEYLKTNDKGEFNIPWKYNFNVHDGKVNILVYSPHYKNIADKNRLSNYTILEYNTKQLKSFSNIIMLEKDNRSSIDRIKFLNQSMSGFLHRMLLSNTEIVPPVVRSVYKEASDLTKQYNNLRSKHELQKLCTYIYGGVFRNTDFPFDISKIKSTYPQFGYYSTPIFPSCENPPSVLPKNILEIQKQILNSIKKVKIKI